MTKLNFNILSAVLIGSASLLIACDNIADDDRLNELPKQEIKRNVLIQEFTGQRCPNCPEGAAMVSDIIADNPEGSVVAVSLHPSGTNFTRPLGGLNLTSATATAYYNYYRPTGFPAAVIDGDTPATNIATWSAKVYNELSTNSPVDIDIDARFSPEDRKLSVGYSLMMLETLNAPATINLWVVESGIIGPQYTNGPQNPTYSHNHVLRGSLTGDWGVSLGNSFSFADNLQGNYERELPEEWVADNCHIVAFLQNPDSKFVYQVVEAHINNVE